MTLAEAQFALVGFCAGLGVALLLPVLIACVYRWRERRRLVRQLRATLESGDFRLIVMEDRED